MQLKECITERRSIRKFREEKVPEQLIEEILQAGILAPSSKNRQPWKFIVVRGEARKEMAEAMYRGIRREREGKALLPGSSCHLEGAVYSAEIMEQAPVTVFVINRLGRRIEEAGTPEDRIADLCNVQSIGAALENMALKATELGLGSLWICDIFFACEELSQWLGTECGLTAAMSFGYPKEHPGARPRRPLQDSVEWRG